MLGRGTMGKTILVLVGLGIAFGAGWLGGSLTSTANTVSNDPNSGRFLGMPEATWLDDGRDMKLLKDFVFIDSRGRSWVAEKDTVVNGASIPRIFWSATGGPLTGKFRNASIVHDAECDRMTSPSTDVHRMFYDACRAGGVDEREAKYLYWAVANYGPTWEIRAVNTVAAPTPIEGAAIRSAPVIVTREIEQKTPTAEELEWAKDFFKNRNPPVEQVPLLELPRNNDAETGEGAVPQV